MTWKGVSIDSFFYWLFLSSLVSLQTKITNSNFFIPLYYRPNKQQSISICFHRFLISLSVFFSQLRMIGIFSSPCRNIVSNKKKKKKKISLKVMCDNRKWIENFRKKILIMCACIYILSVQFSVSGSTHESVFRGSFFVCSSLIFDSMNISIQHFTADCITCNSTTGINSNHQFHFQVPLLLFFSLRNEMSLVRKCWIIEIILRY